MSQKTIPTDRSIAWISLIPQLFLMAVIFGVFYLLNVKESPIFVGLTYLLLSFVLKKIFLKNHNKGIMLTKEGKGREAIVSFGKSASFFANHSWVDRYRFITLLSSSTYSYREMALINSAYCYVQLGEIEKAKEHYEIVLREHPNNDLAKKYLLKLSSSE